MQETEIKVSFNDGGMMKQLQDMLNMLDEIQDRAQGVEMPTQDRPSSRPSSTTTQQNRQINNSLEAFFGQVTNAFVNSAGASVGVTIRNITGLAQDLVKDIPRIGGVIGTAIGAYGQLKGASLEKRQEIASQIMNLEGLEAQIMGLTGESGREIADKQTQKLTRLGFSPEETRSLIVGMGQSFGRELQNIDIQYALQDLATMQRLGINAQGVSGLAGVIKQGTGGTAMQAFETSFQSVAVAQQLGLVGAGIDQFTNSLNSVFSDLTQKGLRFDPKDMLKFTQGIGLLFDKQQSGMRPMQIAQSLMGVAGGARSSFASNFSQLASTALQAKAFEGAKSPFEALKKLEEFQADPEKTRKAIIGAFGEDTAKLILASTEGIGTRDATKLVSRKQIARPTLPTGAKFTAQDVADVMPLTGAQAEQARLTQEAGRKDEDTMKKMIELTGKMDRTLLKFSENEETVLQVYELMISALNKIEQYLP